MAGFQENDTLILSFICLGSVPEAALGDGDVVWWAQMAALT